MTWEKTSDTGASPATIDEAYTKLRTTKAQAPISMNGFAELYGNDVVEKDKAYVRDRLEMFRQNANPEDLQNKKLASVFEAIVTQEIELNDWLGPDVTTRRASLFDDIQNGVDTIASIQESENTNYFGLAIDVT